MTLLCISFGVGTCKWSRVLVVYSAMRSAFINHRALEGHECAQWCRPVSEVEGNNIPNRNCLSGSHLMVISIWWRCGGETNILHGEPACLKLVQASVWQFSYAWLLTTAISRSPPKSERKKGAWWNRAPEESWKRADSLGACLINIWYLQHPQIDFDWLPAPLIFINSHTIFEICH